MFALLVDIPIVNALVFEVEPNVFDPSTTTDGYDLFS